MNTPMLPGFSGWAGPRIFIWARRFGETTWWKIGESTSYSPDDNARMILDYDKLHNGCVAQALVLDETTKPETFVMQHPDSGWLDGLHTRQWP